MVRFTTAPELEPDSPDPPVPDDPGELPLEVPPDEAIALPKREAFRVNAKY